MKINWKILLHFYCLMLTFEKKAKAQDFTFSQFQAKDQAFNPAMIGRMETDSRVVVSYRNQWFASGFPFQTFLASGEWKIHPFRRKLEQMGLSLMLVDDQIGNGQWRNTWISAGASATKVLDEAKKHRISFGLHTALMLRQFNAKNLLYENQFESSTFSFDPGLASGENAGPSRQGFFQINSGLHYQYNILENLELGTGISSLWLYRPSEALTNLSSDAMGKMNRRFTILSHLKWRFSEGLRLEPQAFLSFQGKARDINLGSWLVFANALGSKSNAYDLGLGLFHRLDDALIWAARLGTQKAYGQISWDATMSDLKKTNQNKQFMGIGGMGSLEFTLVYGFDFRPRPYRTFPIPCQTF
jgi:type IX secretion system PorP/SprF family membrane protein